ncbi:MAG: hypothetical protein RSD67_07155 [Oscillospiraceae bacterium]
MSCGIGKRTYKNNNEKIIEITRLAEQKGLTYGQYVLQQEPRTGKARN